MKSNHKSESVSISNYLCRDSVLMYQETKIRSRTFSHRKNKQYANTKKIIDVRLCIVLTTIRVDLINSILATTNTAFTEL
jgi:hypothetical protein